MKDYYLVLVLVAATFAGCRADDADSPPSAVVFSGPAEIIEQRIQPSDTGPGIDTVIREEDFHHIAVPEIDSQRKNILVVYMVGSFGAPENSLQIARFAASLGYGVLNIQYPNAIAVGTACFGQDECYGQFRGETVFGENVEYAVGKPGYNEASNFVTRENSVVNRVVNLLDFLANQEPSQVNPHPAYWQQFLTTDSQSPYTATNLGPAYPDWSKIIVSGHSQGGGMAPMLAMNLADVPARRVVMFAAPNDNDGNGRSANWILQPSATPMERFWGLRHADDNTLGPQVQQSWESMGGSGSGGVGGLDNNAEVDIGNGTGDPGGAQRLVLTLNEGSPHNSTVDSEILPGVVVAWEYLFTGNGID